MFYQKALDEKERLEKQINSIESQLATMPEGNFYCTRNGTRYKWYQSDGKNKTYIPKKNRSFAEKMAAKKYLSLALEEMKREKCAIQFYLRHHNEEISPSVQLLTENAGYYELLSPHFKPLSQQYQDWMNEPYEKNESYPENLKHTTAFGLVVRSKSEQMIATVLRSQGIPFRYECRLELGGVIVYPDFTIIHPKTGQVYYWEHIGMADDAKYNKTIGNRLQNYISNGIIPTHQLIVTFETKDRPLDMQQIEKIVKEFLA